MDIVIMKSNNPKKKYDAIINGSKRISFGAAGYSDYTMHKDEKRKELYIKRHANEDWTRQNVASPAWLSRRIMWENKTLVEAIRHANTMYRDAQRKYKQQMDPKE